MEVILGASNLWLNSTSYQHPAAWKWWKPCSHLDHSHLNPWPQTSAGPAFLLHVQFYFMLCLHMIILSQLFSSQVFNIPSHPFTLRWLSIHEEHRSYQQNSYSSNCSHRVGLFFYHREKVCLEVSPSTCPEDPVSFHLLYPFSYSIALLFPLYLSKFSTIFILWHT